VSRSIALLPGGLSFGSGDLEMANRGRIDLMFFAPSVDAIGRTNLHRLRGTSLRESPGFHDGRRSPSGFVLDRHDKGLSWGLRHLPASGETTPVVTPLAVLSVGGRSGYRVTAPWPRSRKFRTDRFPLADDRSPTWVPLRQEMELFIGWIQDTAAVSLIATRSRATTWSSGYNFEI
jgi:hypothetical protein